MSESMIEHLRHTLEEGRKDGAYSYTFTKAAMESIVKYMEADLAEIERLRGYLQMPRMGSGK
jgi:hypothetical protein